MQLDVNPAFEFFQDASICLETGAMGSDTIVHKYRDKNNAPWVKPGLVLKRFINEIPKGAIVISFLFGSEHIKGSLVKNTNHCPDYDFFLPTGCKDPSTVKTGIQPIDFQYIEQIIGRWLHKTSLALQWIQQRSSAKQIYHVLPPPPVLDPTKVVYKERFLDAIAQYGVLDKQLRLKWYQAYCFLLQQRLDAMNMKSIAPPSEALDANGFLRPDMSEGIGHANALYGQHLARTIQTELGNDASV